MPFTRPSLGELITRIGGDLLGRLEFVGPLLRRAMADVVSKVWGGTVHEVYGGQDWLSKQLFAATAEREQLLGLAAPYGITPAPAEPASGNVTATGTSGSILAETILRLDEATAYRVTTGAEIVAGTATFPVVAVLAGAAGNLPAGTTLTFESPIPGVTASATIADGGIAGGDDGDAGDAGTERIRALYLLRLQEPPQGGADHDYVGWALAAGATRAWVNANENGLGTVVVRFVRDDFAIIFPDSATVAAMQVALDAQRPIAAVVTAAAPTPLAVAFSIHLVPDTADTRAAVTAELADLLSRVSQPGDGKGRGKVPLSQIATAIGIADGVTDYTMTAPSASVVPGVGQLPVVGAISWV